MRIKSGALLLAVLESALLATGCMTIERERRQWVAVTSSPLGATVAVNGVRKGVTPCDIRLDSGQKGQVIRIEYSGYDPVEIRTRRKLSGRVILGNVIMGVSVSAFATLGLSMVGSEDATWGEASDAWALGTVALTGLFMLTDFAFKKGYELSPKALTVTLRRANGPPQVRTILIDADDLRDITWIRVRRD